MDVYNSGNVCMADISLCSRLNHYDDDVAKGSNIRSSQIESHFEGGNRLDVVNDLPVVNQQDDSAFYVASSSAVDVIPSSTDHDCVNGLDGANIDEADGFVFRDGNSFS